MKKVVILVLILALCSSFVSAYIIPGSHTFISTEAIEAEITDLQNGNAEYNILITNNGESEETYRLLYLDPPDWFAQVLPGPSDAQITVPRGEQGRIHVLIKPSNIKEGTYGIRALIREESTKIVYNNAIMKIKVGEPPKEPPAPDFEVSVSVPSQMDPLNAYNVIVTVDNKNERLLEEVKITLKSELLNEETVMTVQPYEKKSASFAVIPLDNIKPQKEQINAKVMYENKTYYEADHNFEIIEYLPPFHTSVDVVKKFLKQERTITVKNNGNTLKEDTVRIEAGLKDRIFSKAEPESQITNEEGKRYLTWSVSLEAGESTQIKITTSYRILILLALIFLAIIGYKIAMSNPLIVKKKIKSVKKSHGGAISSISVAIYIKNRGNTPAKNLRIIERVPKIVHLKSDSFSGSVHPVKMHSHSHEGTLLEYRFPELLPGDERIVTYKAYSKLHVFGILTIKPTVVEFKKDGVKKVSKSRSASMKTEEEQQEE